MFLKIKIRKPYTRKVKYVIEKNKLFGKSKVFGTSNTMAKAKKILRKASKKTSGVSIYKNPYYKLLN